MKRLDLADYQNSVSTSEETFRGEAERLSREGKPFMVKNFSKERDHCFFDELSRRHNLFWIEDTARSTLYLARVTK